MTNNCYGELIYARDLKVGDVLVGGYQVDEILVQSDDVLGAPGAVTFVIRAGSTVIRLYEASVVHVTRKAEG